jgi:3-deoxy-D-manno-octulosonic acid kinase
VTAPPGYTWLARGARRVVVRDHLVAALAPWLLVGPLGPPPDAVALASGRGAAFRVRLAGAPPAVLRLGRRGGLLGRIVTATYAGVRPRPWRELAVTVAAQARRAPVADVLAACVDGWGVYRSAVVTAEVPEARTAIAALRGAGSAAARAGVAAAAGTAVGRLHAAGVAHADLNLTNVLLGRDAVAVVVDLDRARIARVALSAGARRRGLARLARSARKLDPDGALVGADVARAFHAAYAAVAEPACVP